MLWGVVAGLLVVALSVAGIVVLGPRLRSPMASPGDRALLVVASKSGADGSQVAQLVGIAQLTGSQLTVRLVDPMTTVTVPGTSYSQLRDAYSFGGAAGVSNAVAVIVGQRPLPTVAVGQQGLEALVDGAGGVTVTVPAAASVFDGERLFTFEKGPQRLTGSEVVALLSSVEYLKTPDEQQELRVAVASGMANALSASRQQTLAPGLVSSTLKTEDLSALAQRLHAGLPGVVVTPFVK
jgi:hypothetical protein